MVRSFLSFILLSVACIAQAQDATAEIKSVIEQMHRAWETLDMDNVKPLYASDNKALYFDIGVLKSTGLQAYLDDFKPVASDWKSLKLTLNPDFQATKLGDVAWAAFTYTFEINPKSGDVMKAQARSTTVLERRNGRWLIVHEHSSAPVR